MGQSVTQYEQPKPVTSYPTQQSYPQQATAYPNPNPERYSLSEPGRYSLSTGRGNTNRSNSRFDVNPGAESERKERKSRFDTGNGNSRKRMVAGHVLSGFNQQSTQASEDTLKDGLEKVKAVKRRFTESYNTDSSKNGRADDAKRMPPPSNTDDSKMMPPPGPPGPPKPTEPVVASNVASWVMDAIQPKQARSLDKEGRDYNNLTLGYDDSSDED